MALTEQVVISHIGILENGLMQIRRSRRILDGVEIIAERYFRYILEPGQDVSNQPPRIRDICGVVWTPQVIADYLASKQV